MQSDKNMNSWEGVFNLTVYWPLIGQISMKLLSLWFQQPPPLPLLWEMKYETVYGGGNLHSHCIVQSEAQYGIFQSSNWSSVIFKAMSLVSLVTMLTPEHGTVGMQQSTNVN